MDWQTTYPTIETLMLASAERLNTWIERLPAPCTDVERTVRRRLEARMHQMVAEDLRARDPALADRINDLVDKIKARGIKVDVGRY